MSTAPELQQEAAQALQASPIPALRRLSVAEVGDAIVLSGRVPSYYYKQMAQETVLPLLRGRLLQNQVVVARSTS